MTHKEAFWVQVEKNPNLDMTGYMHINLADVQYIGVDRPTKRESGDNEPLHIQIKTTWGLVELKGEQAAGFLERWAAYNPIPKANIDPEAKPSPTGLVGVRSGVQHPIITPVQHQ
jgi:hypothetical protein